MKQSCSIVLVAISLALLQRVSGQDFVNLDFEAATIAPTPVGGSTYPADPAQCFPGWTVGGSGTVVMYNDFSLGAPAAELMGPDFPNGVNYTPLQGSYSTALYFNNNGFSTPPTLSQTGLVPADALSINFLVGNRAFLGNGPSDPSVSLNGVVIPLIPVGGGRMAGNISAFSGSEATLTFSVAPDRVGDNFFYFDDIQFSPSPAPEPSALSLLSFCSLFILWRMKRPNNSPEPTAGGAVHPHRRG